MPLACRFRDSVLLLTSEALLKTPRLAIVHRSYCAIAEFEKALARHQRHQQSHYGVGNDATARAHIDLMAEALQCRVHYHKRIHRLHQLGRLPALRQGSPESW